MGVSTFKPPDPYESQPRGGGAASSSARDVVRRLVEQLGFHDSAGVVPFVQEWPTIVGLDNAAHSRIADFRHGAIVVEVDHPAWLQRMHLDRDRFVRLIRQRFPSLRVRYMHFRVVATLSHRRPQEVEQHPAATHAVQPPDAQKAEVASPPTESQNTPPLERIRDPEVRARLERIRAAIEARQGGTIDGQSRGKS